MRLVTIDCREVGGRPGVMVGDDEILDLAGAPRTLEESQWTPYSVVNVLAAGRKGLAHAQRMIESVGNRDISEIEQLRDSGALLPLAGTSLLPPVRRPGLLLVAEDNGTSFIKSPNTAVGDRARIEAPWQEDAPLTCSGTLSVVIGRSLYRANLEEAEQAIVGYTLVLDLSAADAGNRDRFIEGKQFPGASPIGPAIVTVDEIANARGVRMNLALNGVEVGSGAAYSQAEELPARLAALSRAYAFRPGDLVCFPHAADSTMTHCRLRSGDDVRLTLDGLMSLEVSIG
jgi:hypothetical protein